MCLKELNLSAVVIIAVLVRDLQRLDALVRARGTSVDPR